MPLSTPLVDRSMSGSETYSIARLLSLTLEGKVRVPHFQRPVVWGPSDVRLLFDSIYRGFPVGTLLLWRREVPAAPVFFGGVDIDAPSADDGLVVVDGQQRLTTLVAALSPHPQRVDERFEVFFDLARRRFIGLNRGAPPARAIPVRDTLESRTLLAWLRRNDDQLGDDDYELADELGGALRDYRLPAYVVESDEERTLREVFDRVNSAGKPISRAQVFHALFASETEPGSPATVVEELQRTGFGTLPENLVVQSLLAIRGGDVQRDVHEEFSQDEDIADWYEQTSRAMSVAIRFLQSQGVGHQLLMPSSPPLVVLSAFFHLHPDPQPRVLRYLSWWLWRGWVHGFGREAGPGPILRRAVRDVHPTKGRPDLAPDEFSAVSHLLNPVRDNQVENLEMSDFRTNETRARLALTALASLAPMSPDGERIDVPAVLEQHGVRAIGDVVPGQRTALGARGFWLPGWPTMTGHESALVLLSHGVTPEAAAVLRQGQTSDFVHSRGVHLEEMAASRLNARMAVGSKVIAPLTEVVFDPDVVLDRDS